MRYLDPLILFFFLQETQAEFQLIGCEFDQLIKHIRSLRENFEKLPASNRDTETQGKLIVLLTKLSDYARQAKTRETLSSALVSEEEKIRAKLAEMEEEQVFCLLKWEWAWQIFLWLMLMFYVIQKSCFKCFFLVSVPFFKVKLLFGLYWQYKQS